MPTQKEIILDHLMQGRSITGAEAYTRYGIYRLSAIIHLLKKEGHPIESKLINQEGISKGGSYAKYSYFNEVG